VPNLMINGLANRHIEIYGNVRFCLSHPAFTFVLTFMMSPG
jgi:hypothetical protein